MAASAEPRDLVLIGRGREADVFAWPGGRVLRLAHDPSQAPAMDREALALAAAHRAGAAVPEVHERIEVGGRPGLVMERLEGPDLLTLLGRKPWLLPPVARSSGRAHAEIHRLAAPEGLPQVHRMLSDLLASELVPAEIRDRALDELETLPGGDRLCHGDFHPGNLLRTPGGDMTIDWTAGGRGDPEADVARTLVLIRLAAVSEDSPALVRILERFGRRVLAAGYLRSYRRGRSVDAARLQRWIRVVVAARLAEGIEEERASLLSVAEAPRPLI